MNKKNKGEMKNKAITRNKNPFGYLYRPVGIAHLVKNNPTLPGSISSAREGKDYGG